MILNEKQLDLLKELLNIGIGNSSATLHELVNLPIKLSVPTVEMFLFEEFLRTLKSKWQGRHLTVKLEFKGTFSGVSQIVFPLDSAANLVSILTGENSASTDFDDIKTGTLNEVANIILNGVIGTIGNLLGEHFLYSLPTYHEDALNELLRDCSKQTGFILYGNSHFCIEGKDIEGNIVIILEMPSIHNLIKSLNAMLDE